MGVAVAMGLQRGAEHCHAAVLGFSGLVAIVAIIAINWRLWIPEKFLVAGYNFSVTIATCHTGLLQRVVGVEGIYSRGRHGRLLCPWGRFPRGEWNGSVGRCRPPSEPQHFEKLPPSTPRTTTCCGRRNLAPDAAETRRALPPPPAPAPKNENRGSHSNTWTVATWLPTRPGGPNASPSRPPGQAGARPVGRHRS